MTEVRRRFKNTKFGGSGHVIPDTWWNWERATSAADVTADPFTALGLCPIQRAVSVVAGDVARLPIQIQEYIDGRWEE